MHRDPEEVEHNRNLHTLDHTHNIHYSTGLGLVVAVPILRVTVSASNITPMSPKRTKLLHDPKSCALLKCRWFLSPHHQPHQTEDKISHSSNGKPAVFVKIPRLIPTLHNWLKDCVEIMALENDMNKTTTVAALRTEEVWGGIYSSDPSFPWVERDGVKSKMTESRTPLNFIHSIAKRRPFTSKWEEDVLNKAA